MLITHPIRISSSYVHFSLKLSLLPINSPFQAPVPYWCWISGGDLERIMGEYLWLGIGVLVSVVLYTLLFFRLRGNIQVDPQNWKHPIPTTPGFARETLCCESRGDGGSTLVPDLLFQRRWPTVRCAVVELPPT